MVEPVVIGDATLYCGDCREILPGIDGVDFVFTDPPYGHNNNNNGDLIERWEAALGVSRKSTQPRPISNDGVEANELVRWFFAEANRLLPAGGCCCCCGGGGGPDPQFARWSLWLDEALGFKQMVVWDKGPMGLGWHYRRSYETVLVGQKPGAACRWYDVSQKIENVIRPGVCNKILPTADEHPTLKPVALPTRFISLHSLPRHCVLDPFMGSGTTGVAAMQLGRKFIGIEIERRWFDIACRRIEEAQRQYRLALEPVA